MKVLIFIIIALYDHIFSIAGRTYQINPTILKAIALVESNMKSTLRINSNGTKDYGIMQINSYWVRKYKLDTLKLLNDPLYNIMWGAFILALCIKKHGYTWKAIGYYHSPKLIRQKIYIKRVVAKYLELKEKNNGTKKIRRPSDTQYVERREPGD